MSYLVLCDSCTDFTKEQKQNPHFISIPLALQVGDYEITDDETFDQTDFLKRVAESSQAAKSSCPAPNSFMNYFDQADDIYMVTLSSHLSGSYNSAQLAKSMYEEDHTGKNIYTFNSRSASCGQTLVALKIDELASSGLPFEEVIKQTETFIKELGTKFILETLENLRKNGRLSNLSATIASALNIKPVMTSTPEGEIDKLTQARGMKKGIQKMADAIAQDAVNPSEKTLAIAHCNNYARAEYVKEEVLKRVPFKDVFIVDSAGVTSLYAADGGIVVCY